MSKIYSMRRWSFHAGSYHKVRTLVAFKPRCGPFNFYWLNQLRRVISSISPYYLNHVWQSNLGLDSRP